MVRQNDNLILLLSFLWFPSSCRRSVCQLWDDDFARNRRSCRFPPSRICNPDLASSPSWWSKRKWRHSFESQSGVGCMQREGVAEGDIWFGPRGNPPWQQRQLWSWTGWKLKSEWKFSSLFWFGCNNNGFVKMSPFWCDGLNIHYVIGLCDLQKYGIPSSHFRSKRVEFSPGFE